VKGVRKLQEVYIVNGKYLQASVKLGMKD